jgi:hypothetical protein
VAEPATHLDLVSPPEYLSRNVLNGIHVLLSGAVVVQVVVNQIGNGQWVLRASTFFDVDLERTHGRPGRLLFVPLLNVF